MNRQQVFDHVVSHVRGMNHRAGDFTSSHFQCSYLDSKNRMCAVGSLFPLCGLSKELLVEIQLSPCDALDIAKFFGGDLPEWFTENDRMLKDLQVIHDTSEHWDAAGINGRGEIRLKMTAEHYGVVYTPK